MINTTISEVITDNPVLKVKYGIHSKMRTDLLEMLKSEIAFSIL